MNEHDQIRAKIERDIDAFFCSGGKVRRCTAADNANANPHPKSRKQQRDTIKRQTRDGINFQAARKAGEGGVK